MNRICSHCDGGWSKTYKLLERQVRAMLTDKESLKDEGYEKLLNSLTGTSIKLFGFGASGLTAATIKIGNAAGMSEGWYKCEHCQGSGELDEEQEVLTTKVNSNTINVAGLDDLKAIPCYSIKEIGEKVCKKLNQLNPQKKFNYVNGTGEIRLDGTLDCIGSFYHVNLDKRKKALGGFFGNTKFNFIK